MSLDQMLQDFRAHWASLPEPERTAEGLYGTVLVLGLDIEVRESDRRALFVLTEEQLLGLIWQARKDGHAHDPIECGCELTAADAPPRPRSEMPA
ncbi:hypothetical protein [Micromonospora maritima]|uniref:hypothetical protein n=1 Tax=Micromonospora maritima TaxID=986711 RepID=UPI00157DE1CA|nr:hypothetical protein [Micromonospora maritima]